MPSKHTQAARLVDASRETELGGHGLHACRFDLPDSLLKVEGPQGKATPVLHHEPGGHAAHSSALRSPVTLPTVPAAQGVGAELPAPHHEAIGQTSHAVAPSAP